MVSQGGGGTTTGTPSAGSVAAFIPNTKIWAHNANVVLNPNSQATDIVGFELGLLNKKIDNYVGYGFDCVNLGTFGIGTAFQTRGKFNIGFASYTGKNFGFVSYGASTVGVYSSSDAIGVTAQNNTYSFQAKNPSGYAFILQKTDNSFVTGMDNLGRWQGLRLNMKTVAIGNAIDIYTKIALATPSANGDKIFLPPQSPGLTVSVRNTSSSFNLFADGPYEDGLGGITTPPKNTIELSSDGSYWHPMSRYAP